MFYAELRENRDGEQVVSVSNCICFSLRWQGATSFDCESTNQAGRDPAAWLSLLLIWSANFGAQPPQSVQTRQYELKSEQRVYLVGKSS